MAVGVVACDPCAGVSTCSREPAAALTGRIINFPAQRGVGGVAIQVAIGDSVRATVTDQDGFWRVEIPQATATDSSARRTRIQVRAPGANAPYVVEDVQVKLSTRAGDAVDVGRWYDVPQLRFVGEVRPRNGVELSGATVQVDRVGGVAGSRVQNLRASVGGDRRFIVEAPAEGLGVMLLRVAFTVPGVAEPFVHQGARILTMYRDTTANVQGTYALGPGFPYQVRVLRRGTTGGVAGATVIFRRTSGARVRSEVVSTVTNSEGYAPLPMEPVERGNIVGMLEIRAQGVPTTVFADVSIPTVDDDEARLAGNFSIGVQLLSVVEMYRRTSFRPLIGVPYTFTPKSGALTAPISGVTNVLGYAEVKAPLPTEGKVTGTLAVQARAGGPSELFEDLVVEGFADDSIRRIAYLGVGPSALYGGALQALDGFVPLVGVKVEFRRRGGVPMETDVFETTTNEIGVFRMFPAPLEDGEVMGDITFRLPPPYRDTTFTDIRFPTFRSDNTRFGRLFRVTKP